MSIRAVLLLAALLPCVPICFFRPFFGVIMWTIISFASPQWYAWGAAEYFPSAELIAIPTLLGFAIFNSRGWARMVTRESILLLLLWLWFTFTSIISSTTPLFADHADVTWSRWQFVTKVLLMTVITMGIVDSFARLRTLVIVTASCFTFYVVKALPFIIMTGGAFRLYGPPRSMVEDNNDLGLALNMTLPLLFFLSQTEKHRRVKQLFLALVGIVILGIFCTYSRGALVGLVVVMALMLMALKQRLILIPMLLLAVVTAVVFAPDKWKDRMDLTKKDTTLDQSAYSRINAWTFSWNLAKAYPLTGGGFETFQTELFDRFAPNSHDVHGPHSVYFGVLAEHGFIGLALYLTLVISCFLSARRISKAAHSYGDEVAVGYTLMFRFSLIGFLTSGLFLGRAYFDYWFAIMAFIVILKKVSFGSWTHENTLVTGEPLDEQSDEDAALQYAS
jgi:probable O-glycosylation ligase (exosortase A-associated)